ncbi:MAG: glutathione S-transferase [Tabrizicola sp.]|uniref:glutathione S-transferase family protein n=1 Tax=Tabrizicola sp. TaxID=2005166 RepID=UPI0027356963|nr:glutathione S-transferase [Tabrizicola sp.]MDP3263759.1 glutathione S-transferase [Tabrizicola sp.]MDP3647123.1 glutathione S-transferase [Paracoccaceae bacterium]MDZ4068001.1 glutathione S-transferase [Tabrizicola sp.]
MYTLHYAPDNASLIIRLVLDGAGIPYRTALVDRRTRQQDSAEYRALNPAGLIPTLITPHGPISETGAILLWLADTHGLGPKPADPDRLPFLKWLFFLSNTAHADLRQMFYPHLYCPVDAHPAHAEIMTARMNRHFALLDKAAAEHPTLFAPPRPLAAYTITLARWCVLYTDTAKPWFSLTDYPTLRGLAEAQERRVETPVIARAEGLGPAPFTDPQDPNPPEGSAL